MADARRAPIHLGVHAPNGRAPHSPNVKVLHISRTLPQEALGPMYLSRAVKEVEAELGARLFVRTTRSTQLTRAGRLFLVGRYHAIATTGAASAMPLGRSRG